MDFDLDDPLGDLLSDKSDDSFYDDDKGRKNSKPKLSRNSSLDKKKSNLFGLENDSVPKDIPSTKVTNKSNSDWLGIPDSPVETRANIEKSGTKDNKKDSKVNIKQIKTSFADGLNFLDDFGLSDIEPKAPNVKPAEKQTSSSAILDDILGTTKKSDTVVGGTSKGESSNLGYNPSSMSVSNKPEGSLNLKTDNLNNPTGYNPTFQGPSVSRNVRLSVSSSKLESDKNFQSENKDKLTKAESSVELSKSTKKEVGSRRQRTNADWLGLFPNDEENLNEPTNITKVESTDSALPDWLRSQETKQDNVAITKEKTASKSAENLSVIKETVDTENVNVSIADKLSEHFITIKPLQLTEVFGGNPNLNLLNNAELEQQSAAICLQQQESQLMVALQLKAQEERLAALHERQEESRRVQSEVVSAHRQQLDQILKGQADQRSQLQDIIFNHQQRINTHIQSLLRPPPSMTSKGVDHTPQESKADEIDFEVKVSEDSSEGRHTRRVTERDQLEQLIVNLKDNHARELEIMENSYRHQVDLIQDSLVSIEERLKSENDKLSQYYVKRIERLEDENSKLIQQGDESIRSIREKQKLEREEIEAGHQRDMEILQEQNKTMIANIRESIAIEHSTIKEATDYSRKLDVIVKDVEQNNQMCVNFVETMEARVKDDIVKRESILLTKEKQISYMLESLEEQRKSIENESFESRTTLRNWEERLRQQTKTVDEEKLSLKHLKMELDMEREIHKSEKEKQKTILENEREIMEKNISNVQEKYKDLEKTLTEKLNSIEEERLLVINQRKIAEDLKKKNEETRRNIENELTDVKENKRHLVENQQKLNQDEMALTSRSQELEVLTRSALAKHASAERKISEASYVQQKFEDKMKELQDYAISLNAREQQIAKDKVALSRERLLFYNMQKEYQCGLCKSSTNYHDYSRFQHSSGKIKNVNLSANFLETTVSRDVSEDERHAGVFGLSNKTLVNEDLERKVHFDDRMSIQNGVFNNDRLNFNGIQSHWPSPPEIVEVGGSNDFSKYYEVPSVFQEIVDPRLVLLKLDIQNATRNSSHDATTN